MPPALLRVYFNFVCGCHFQKTEADKSPHGWNIHLQKNIWGFIFNYIAVKKIVLKIAIAVFWGLSLPWMIIYALLEMVHLINKSKQGDSYSELEENKKLFFIVLIIPFVSIIILFIGGPSRFLVLISLYGFLLIASIILILFTDKGFTAFNKDYKKLASDFKEFGIFLFVDFLSFLIVGITYVIQPDLAFISGFPWELVISIVVCGISGVGLKKYLALYPQIKNSQFVYTENHDFLTVSPRTLGTVSLQRPRVSGSTLSAIKARYFP